jgi:hypothetical protein
MWIVEVRRLLWLSISLTAAYAIATALLFYPPPQIPSKGQALILVEATFAGPVIIACALSIFMARLEARLTLVGFEVVYCLVTVAIFYWTFGFEHGAQYQLMLLFIPIIGFPAVVAAGLAAAMVR